MFYEIAASPKLPLTPFIPFSPARCREFWEALPSSLKNRAVEDAKALCPVVWPQILACDFLEYTRSGNRIRFEDKQFARRTALGTLVLAEACDYKGTFLDDIINGIYLICEETAWQLPPHNSYIRDTPSLPLPDPSRPVIDLFAAETGAVLAVAVWFLRDELRAVSPLIEKQVVRCLKERILEPYLKEHFWWMGDGVSPMNNWTIWCTQNVLMTAALWEEDEEISRAILQKAAKSADFFLAEYGDDGCCDEGPQYYRHAGLCLFNTIEIMNGMTDHSFSSLYREPKICNIAAYLSNVHACGPYYINFSDCAAVAGLCSAREYLFGKRTEQKELMELAAGDCRITQDPLLTQEHNLFYRIQNLFALPEILSIPQGCNTEKKDIFYPSTGLFIARDSRFCLAVKAGDNDDSHNHNDTGSFTIYKDGKPLFADIGVETYQAKTFSPQRYEIWTMQSAYHNLPSFITADGHEQMEHNGPDFKAEHVDWGFEAQEAHISMELKNAYPKGCITSFKRSVVFKRSQEILITDQVCCPGLTPVLNLITAEKPLYKESCLILGTLAVCKITGALTDVSVECLPITDPRLKLSWKNDLWRTRITFNPKKELALRII